MKRPIRAFQFKKFSRRQQQVLTWWKPGSPHADKDIIVCDGSIRAGKTISITLSFVLWAQASFSGENFILAGRTMGALKRNVISPLLQILRTLALPYHYDRQEHVITIGTNTYYLFGASTEASQDTLQGLTAAGGLADEAALFPEGFIEQMIGRCSVDGAKLWFNCNPEGPYHYLKTEFIDQAAEKRILHLHFTLEDNLTLSPRTKARYRRMFTGLWYQRMILGLWVMAEGAIYDMWDEAQHVVDAVPAGVRITQYTVGGDYGTGNPTAFLLLGEGGDGVTYTLAEYYWDSKRRRRQKTDEEYADDLEAFLQARVPGEGPLVRRVAAIYLDPSAASFLAVCRQRGLPVHPAENAVIDGIRFVGMRLTSGKLKVVRAGCPQLVKDIPGYVWDAKAAARGVDAPVKQGDHTLDGWRYGVYSPHVPATGRVAAAVTLPW